MTKKDKDEFRNLIYQFNMPTGLRVVARYKSMKFIIHPNENCGHNRAHVHIELSEDATIEVDIEDCTAFNVSGKFPKNKIKLAENFVRDHRELFERNWNELTNGITIDIDKNGRRGYTARRNRVHVPTVRRTRTK